MATAWRITIIFWSTILHRSLFAVTWILPGRGVLRVFLHFHDGGRIAYNIEL